MKKVYLDITAIHGIGICLDDKDAEVICAGTSIYSMPQSCYNQEYQRFADEYDIHFIFDGTVLNIDFYAVPQFDVLATDSNGGYIGTIGGHSDLQSDYSIGYIDKNKNCFVIASSGKEFVQNAATWKENKKVYNGIYIFANKEDAQRKFEFIDTSELEKIIKTKCLST